MDCVNSALGYGSAGCNGGYSSDVLSYVAGFRATTETDYRLTAWPATAAVPAGCKLQFAKRPSPAALRVRC